MNLLQSLEPLIIVFHFLICIFLIVVILLQAGKGADMGATFGAGGSQTLFGARGAATFLSKMTTAAAALFLITSFSLASIHRHRGPAQIKDSVLDTTAPVQQEAQPQTQPQQENTEPAPIPSAPVEPHP